MLHVRLNDPIFARSRITSEIKNPISASGRILNVFIEVRALTVIATLAAAFGSFLQTCGQEMEHER